MDATPVISGMADVVTVGDGAKVRVRPVNLPVTGQGRQRGGISDVIAKRQNVHVRRLDIADARGTVVRQLNQGVGKQLIL